ncbi:MAG TPA: hypothetical protein VG917_01460 [Patescibacteria group bacterium]|nr:hypothetical protein [Patescibacteria group bacterium]
MTERQDRNHLGFVLSKLSEDLEHTDLLQAIEDREKKPDIRVVDVEEAEAYVEKQIKELPEIDSIVTTPKEGRGDTGPNMIVKLVPSLPDSRVRVYVGINPKHLRLILDKFRKTPKGHSYSDAAFADISAQKGRIFIDGSQNPEEIQSNFSSQLHEITKRAARRESHR